MAIEINLQDSASLEKFENLKKIYRESLDEYIKLISLFPGSLRTELAAEILKGAIFLKKFIETGAVPSPSSDQ